MSDNLLSLLVKRKPGQLWGVLPGPHLWNHGRLFGAYMYFLLPPSIHSCSQLLAQNEPFNLRFNSCSTTTYIFVMCSTYYHRRVEGKKVTANAFVDSNGSKRKQQRLKTSDATHTRIRTMRVEKRRECVPVTFKTKNCCRKYAFSGGLQGSSHSSVIFLGSVALTTARPLRLAAHIFFRFYTLVLVIRVRV